MMLYNVRVGLSFLLLIFLSSPLSLPTVSMKKKRKFSLGVVKNKEKLNNKDVKKELVVHVFSLMDLPNTFTKEDMNKDLVSDNGFAGNKTLKIISPLELLRRETDRFITKTNIHKYLSSYYETSGKELKILKRNICEVKEDYIQEVNKLWSFFTEKEKEEEENETAPEEEKNVTPKNAAEKEEEEKEPSPELEKNVIPQKEEVVEIQIDMEKAVEFFMTNLNNCTSVYNELIRKTDVLLHQLDKIKPV